METTTIDRPAVADREATRLRRWLYADARGALCAQAHGDVLDMAISDGRNLALYPGDAVLTGVGLDDTVLETARERAADLGREVVLRSCDPHVLPFPAESFDCVVCVLGLCRVADDAIVLAETHRVLRPGGTLMLLDHVLSTWPPVRGLQRAAERLLHPITGDRLTRRPSDLVRDLGFEMIDTRRRRAGLVEKVVARKAS